MSEHFPNNEKLKSKKLFDQLFSEGKSVNAFPVKLVFVPIENQENASTHKTGVSAPKRKFKKAVDRNRLKRLLREAFRKNKHLINNTEQKYALLFIYTGKEIVPYSTIFSAVEKLLHKFVEHQKK
ncbi:MAG TPA: ribonuclease P protein component [Flavobacteriaceae bacterium]|nr:ribonuclease P protein component [Flavobacteriaceae bacterium]